jgi:hypothetical protein
MLKNKMFYYYIMSRFNTNATHPLIPNAQQYMFEQQYVSIHSEDRNMVKYPNASEFELELPQDYLNVQGCRLVSGFFPFTIYTFSEGKKNNIMTFKITELYNPIEHSVVDPLQLAIFNTLYNYIDNYTITIEDGYYTAEQMATELTNKFNEAVTNILLDSTSTLTDTEKTALEAAGGYSEFVIVYNKISRKLWFGNKSSGFVLTNTATARYEEDNYKCVTSNILPAFNNWGLPGYLGFTRCNAESILMANKSDARFYYGDVIVGDNGYWLIANAALAGASAYYIEAPLQIDIDPPSYFYMEIKFLNFWDETSPYNYSTFTQQTNQTNGIVKSAFAKIPYNNQYYSVDTPNSSAYYKIYNPPMERFRKLSIKLRNHDGSYVDFQNANYTFTLEFTLFRPQNLKAYSMYTPESLSNAL